MTAMSTTNAYIAWDNCLHLLGKTKLGPEDSRAIFQQFDIALRNGEEALRLEPNDSELRGKVEHWRSFYEGLEDSKSVDNQLALVLCLRGNFLYNMLLNCFTVAQKTDNFQIIDDAIRVIEDEGIPSLELALWRKPGYLAAQKILSACKFAVNKFNPK